MTKAYRLHAGFSPTDSGFYPYRRLEDIQQWLSHHADTTAWWEVKEWTDGRWITIDSSKQGGEPMTTESTANNWKALWLMPNGYMGHYDVPSKAEAISHASSREGSMGKPVWWAVLERCGPDGKAWREAVNCLDYTPPEPKPITLGDILQAEFVAQKKAGQLAKMEQLKAMMNPDHFFDWDDHRRTLALFCYAHSQGNEALTAIAYSIVDRNQLFKDWLGRDILALTSDIDVGHMVHMLRKVTA